MQEHPRLELLVCEACLEPPKPRPEPPRRDFEPLEAWIYFIQAGGSDGPVKIGYGANPSGRLLEFQTANHLKLRLVRQIPGTLLDEKELHRALRQHHLRGEWFTAAVLREMRSHPLWRAFREVRVNGSERPWL